MNPMSNAIDKNNFTWAVTLLMIVMLLMSAGNFLYDNYFSTPIRKPIATGTKSYRSPIDSQFSTWNGAHLGLQSYIKKNMLDPKSYEHIETKHWEKEKSIVVTMKFRGKNSFGGVTVQSMSAEFDHNGKMLGK